jgi:predicted dehydrogenase
MIKVAIIGLGWWGRHMVKCVQSKESGFDLVRGVDVNMDAAKDFAAEKNVPLSGDFQDALDDPEVNAVILTTPQHLHEDQIIQGATAGKHVFCEKPLTMTKVGAERAAAACQDAGVQLGVGHERRFERGLVEIRNLVKSGKLGTIMHVESDSSHDKLKDLKADDWRVQQSIGPSVPMTGMGVHMTDLYVDMFGKLDTVYALKTSRVVDHEGGDVITVQVKFESGLTGTFSCITVTPFFYRYQVFGSDGWAQVLDSAHPDDTSSVATLTTCFQAGEINTQTFTWSDTVTANLKAFAAAVEGHATYPFSDGQMINNVGAMEAIVKSIQSGNVEKV